MGYPRARWDIGLNSDSSTRPVVYVGSRCATPGNFDLGGSRWGRSTSRPRSYEKIASAGGDFNDTVGNTREYRPPKLGPSILGRLISCRRCACRLFGYPHENAEPFGPTHRYNRIHYGNAIANQCHRMDETTSDDPDGSRRTCRIPYSVGTVQEIVPLYQNRDKRMLIRRTQLDAPSLNDIWRSGLNIPQLGPTAHPPMMGGRYRVSADGRDGVPWRMKIGETRMISYGDLRRGNFGGRWCAKSSRMRRRLGRSAEVVINRHCRPMQHDTRQPGLRKQGDLMHLYP